MQLETLEKNKVKLTFEVGPERFEEGLKHSYNKNKGNFIVPGFRKGRVPRKIVETQYGKEALYKDAIDFVFGDAYDAAVKEHKLEIVSRPEIDVESVNSDEGVVFTAEVFIKPEVSVSNYMGITYSKADTTATDEEIDAQIDIDRDKNARIHSIDDRPVQMGDIAVIDFKGFTGGEPFGGGSGKDYDLTIGSGQFIPGFEEQIVGHAIGESFEINVVFPENYHDKSLSGKDAMFQVELKEIKVKEMPELNDEFAQDVSEFDTLAEYRAFVRDRIEREKADEAQTKKENEIMETIVANAVMDPPEVMIEDKANDMLNEFARRLSQQGMTLELYLQVTGETPESILESYMEGAENQVRGTLAIEAIAKTENIEATEDELTKELEKLAKAYNMELERMLDAMGEDAKESIKSDIRMRKAFRLIMDSAVEKE